MTDEYNTYIEQVLTEVPDADRDAIREEFEKYHTASSNLLHVKKNLKQKLKSIFYSQLD